jgi:hypothetical protein
MGAYMVKTDWYEGFDVNLKETLLKVLCVERRTVLE